MSEDKLAADPDRLVRLSDLVSLSEIAERAGVTPQAIAMWHVRDQGTSQGFPLPVRDVPRSRLWLWAEVEPWLWLTGRMRP